jgi:hypothetical protein
MSDKLASDSQGKIVVFGAKRIRRTWHDEQWFFSVVDIIAALTDSDNPRNYWNMMKARERKQSEVQLSTLCVQLKLISSDGKTYSTDCVSTEAAFRIIQSIPRNIWRHHTELVGSVFPAPFVRGAVLLPGRGGLRIWRRNRGSLTSAHQQKATQKVLQTAGDCA